MHTHDKRRMALKMLRNTFNEVAKTDETIDENKLIGEIMNVFEVSKRTAQNYIDELITIGYIKRDADMGWLWLSKEEEIRLDYLTKVKEHDIPFEKDGEIKV